MNLIGHQRLRRHATITQKTLIRFRQKVHYHWFLRDIVSIRCLRNTCGRSKRNGKYTTAIQ